MRHLAFGLLCLLVTPVSVFAQQVYAYSSVTTDGQSNNVSAYASTSADYNTEYYYDLYVTLTAFTPTAPVNILCGSSGSNSNADATTSCNFSVSAGTVFDIQTEHQVYATYSYDQIECCQYDGDWYDAYSYSLLGETGNNDYSDNTTWFAPSSYPEATSQTVVLDAYLDKEITKPPCAFPSGEQSLSYNFDNPGSRPYLGQFLVTLNGSGNFTSRSIGETNYSTGSTDSCYDSSMPFSAMQVPRDFSWFGSWVHDYDNYYFNQQVYNAYGFDNIGLIDTNTLPAPNRVQRYLQKLQNNGGGSCGFNWAQDMRMACGNTSQNFSTGNESSVYFSASPGQNNYTVSRQGVAINRSVP